MRSLRLILLSILCVSCCGYRAGTGSFPSGTRISVPYIQGDWSGEYTSALIHELATSSDFCYVSEGGDFRLNIILTDFRDNNIGFRYDRDKQGKRTHNLVPIEMRKQVEVEITLYEVATGLNLFGPVALAAEVEFDHDYESKEGTVNVFSLGQLNDIDAAKEAASGPLSRSLARKIVDYLNANVRYSRLRRE